MNDLKKLKVGVIGLGFMGELHANVYSTLTCPLKLTTSSAV